MKHDLVNKYPTYDTSKITSQPLMQPQKKDKEKKEKNLFVTLKITKKRMKMSSDTSDVENLNLYNFSIKKEQVKEENRVENW